MMLDEVKRWYRAGDGYWFVPKMYGFGATPVTWQGWALTFGCVGALLLDTHFADAIAPRLVIAVALIAAMIVIAARKTDGGWRWRWGPRPRR